jgi:light-regulated signal transduction histidine kinase (bacteriophytochrome)
MILDSNNCFKNLSENAIKYNDKEKVIIEIGCSENQNEIVLLSRQWYRNSQVS